MDADNTCGHPDRTTYSCAPIEPSSGAIACRGGPLYHLHGDPENLFYWDDRELTFPVGCEAAIPQCAVGYKDTIRTFRCVTVPGGTEPRWQE